MFSCNVWPRRSLCFGQMAVQNLQIGVVGLALAQDARDAARLAREAGFDGLVFDARTRWLDLTELSLTGRREFLHMLASQQQALIAVRADAGPRGLAPDADADRAIGAIDLAMSVAADLNVRFVTAEIGPLPPPPAAVASPPRPKITPQQAGLIILPEQAAHTSSTEPEQAASSADHAFAARVQAALVEIGRRADRCGVTVAWGNALASFSSLAHALSSAACPCFGIELDPVAILRDRWSIDETFSALGPLVRHVRARDAIGGAGARTTPAVLGRGSTNWDQLLAALRNADYRGVLTIDPLDLQDRAAAALEGLQFLRARLHD